MTAESLELIRPDDWHLHLRDGQALETTVAHSSRCFSRAIVMPNLKPPVTTVDQAMAYRGRIISALSPDAHFDPLMTLYLTDNLSQAELIRVSEEPSLLGVKYYPAGATTNSDSGVTAIDKVIPALEIMAERQIPLLIHGEVTETEIDIFDREKRFIDTVLEPLRERLPTLKVVLEHITTRDAVEFVKAQQSGMGATITVHHLLYNRNDLLVGGVRPHFYCLPVLKRNIHQTALIEAAISGDGRFFLGTDSAPHPKGEKESAWGCAGIYTSPAAIELYAEVFEDSGALDKLEGFASVFGPNFYGLPINSERIQLVKESWKMPANYPFAGDTVIPVRAGSTLRWRLVA